MSSETSLKKSTLLIALGKYSNVIFAFIANIILARLLSPEEYGVVAVVTVFSTFFSLFTDMGFGAGVIQNRDLSKKDIDYIFSYTVYIGIVCATVFCGLSHIIAAIYDNVAYVPIGYILSISLLFNSCNMIPNAILMRDKRFKEVGIRTAVISFLTYGITIGLATFGFSYYSLVLQSVVSAFATFIWNWISTKPKFVFKPVFTSMKKIMSISMYNFVYDIVNYFSRNFDNLLTGKFIGEAALGYYNKAYTLMLYPVHYLTSVITPVLHPIFSDYQDDHEKIYTQYLKVTRFLIMIGIYMSVFSFFASKELIIVLYGAKWEQAVPCMQALSLTIWIQMSVASCTSVYRSLGRTDLRLVSSLIYVPIQLVMIVIGALSGSIVTMSIYVAVSYVVRFVIEYYYLIKKAFGMSVIRFLGDIKGMLLVFVLTLAVSTVSMLISINSLLLSAIIKLIICTAVFTVFSLIFKQFNYLLSALPNGLKRRIKIKI